MLQSHADHLLCLSQSVQHHLSLLHDAYICSFLENLVTNKDKWCRKSTGEEECEKHCQLVSVLDVKGQVLQSYKAMYRYYLLTKDETSERGRCG